MVGLALQTILARLELDERQQEVVPFVVAEELRRLRTVPPRR
jgi:hypothetical protein